MGTNMSEEKKMKEAALEEVSGGKILV